MKHGAIWRVWYRKRSGVSPSFKDIRDFFCAADFATLVVADRIEVIRPLAVTGRRESAIASKYRDCA